LSNAGAEYGWRGRPLPSSGEWPSDHVYGRCSVRALVALLDCRNRPRNSARSWGAERPNSAVFPTLFVRRTPQRRQIHTLRTVRACPEMSADVRGSFGPGQTQPYRPWSGATWRRSASASKASLSVTLCWRMALRRRLRHDSVVGRIRRRCQSKCAVQPLDVLGTLLGVQVPGGRREL
jgi:hypothetical protein